eukprot:TRINITY_DN38140_c0_g1_i3.p1 TRINITY_DN38140_c0_g1~~TRINITY_DN38140_c0_g1_i3.p1  ORF type:complete len:420 (+),score=80.86 TRINITY_DN38140_c0_g1_i3:117-1376(+)
MLTPMLILVASLLCVVSRSEITPTQIHLAIGKNSQSMTVSWSTSSQADSLVEYGTSANLGRSAIGNSSTYTTTTVPRDGSAFVKYTSPFLHHVKLEELTPSTTFYYRVGSDDAMSPVLQFHTASAPGDDQPMVMLAVGDLGQTVDSNSTVRHMLQQEAAVLLHAGDMSYADCDGGRWDRYFDMIEPLSSAMPWMVAAGNHEIEPDGTGGIMSPYKHRYAMPEAAPGVDSSKYFQDPAQKGYDCTPSAFTGSYDFGNSFYSFEAGLSHVIILNSYSHTESSSAQYKWLEQDLQSVDSSVTPWVVAVFHSPWYNTNHDHQSEFNTVAMRDSMEALMHTYNVSIALCGHVHAYERSRPVYLNQTNTRGTTYFNIGDGGNREGHSAQWLSPSSDWSATHNGDMYGHSRPVSYTHLTLPTKRIV